ncbi:MAG: glycoside hydrolase [bacterium]
MSIENFIKKISILPLIFSLLIIGSFSYANDVNIISNGGFEEIEDGRPLGWERLWTNEPDSGKLTIDKEVYHGGSYSARIENRGTKDWCLNYGEMIGVKPGDVFTLKAWVKIEGEGSVKICVITYDNSENVLKWDFGDNEFEEFGDWYLISSKFAIPRNVTWIRPRILGMKPANIWADDFSLTKGTNILQSEPNDIPKQLTISNDMISVTLDTTEVSLSVLDKGTGQSWRQQSLDEALLLNAKIQEDIEFTWLDVLSVLEFKTVIKLPGNEPEFSLSVIAEDKMEMTKALQFPYPFVSAPGTYLVLPVNEGVSYPVEDETIEPMDLITFGGHGSCMPFWGVTNGEQGYTAVMETPDDATIRMDRINGKLCVRPGWLPQKRHFGYDRQIHYVFFHQGGHVAIAKRYRKFAMEKGLFKTLDQKRKENTNVDLLIGAVDIWFWGKNPLPIIQEMKSLGIERILWSNGGSAEEIEAMNKMGGILTSRYDIYQDLMDPEIIKKGLVEPNPDWTQEGWPEDLMLDQKQDRRKGWYVKVKDGTCYYSCGVLCDKQALKYARKRVTGDLKTHPYRGRFIDTTTASPWRECYNPAHPMTRSESRHWKMELLRYMSEYKGLITGSETGHEAAVPYVHYFEGMLSLWPYRLPGAGRNMQQIVEEVPEKLEKFQLGHKYRLPLWELVYHDCVVSYWYWGDYNNKLPALWDKRDLFNILYGTPPMFMFTSEIWENNKARFVKSYQDVCPVARATGYSEMTDHRFLLPDRSVQQTAFSNGIKVIVNFGDKLYTLADGKIVNPMGFLVIKDK